MKLKPIQFILLLTFALWATGLAQFAHERIAHQDAPPTPLIKTPAGCQRVPVQHHSPASHDDCAVCQMLAMMKAEKSAPPTIVPTLQQTLEIIAIEHISAITQPAESFLPIRGPPAA